MPSLGEDIRTWILADASIAAVVGTRVEQNKLSQGKEGLAIWYGRATTENADTIDAAVGTVPFSQTFDLECIGPDIDAVLDLAELVKALNYTRGSIGSGTVQGVFIDDHQDDYVSRAIGSDDGRHIAALTLEFTGYAQGA